MSDVIKEIGERVISLDGTEYKLVPSFQALAASENIANCSLIDMYTRLCAGAPKLTDVAAILFGCLSEGNPKMTFGQVGVLVMKEGLTKCAPICFEMVDFIFEGAKKKLAPSA